MHSASSWASSQPSTGNKIKDFIHPTQPQQQEELILWLLRHCFQRLGMFSSRPKAASSFNLQKVTISASSWTLSHLKNSRLTKTHFQIPSLRLPHTPSSPAICSGVLYRVQSQTLDRLLFQNHSCKGSHPHHALETYHPYFHPPSLVPCEIRIPCELLLTYRTLPPLFLQYLLDLLHQHYKTCSP